MIRRTFKRIIDWAEEPDWDSAQSLARTSAAIVGGMVGGAVLIFLLVLMGTLGGIAAAGLVLYGLYRWVRLAFRPVNQ